MIKSFKKFLLSEEGTIGADPNNGTPVQPTVPPEHPHRTPEWYSRQWQAAEEIGRGWEQIGKYAADPENWFDLHPMLWPLQFPQSTGNDDMMPVDLSPIPNWTNQNPTNPTGAPRVPSYGQPRNPDLPEFPIPIRPDLITPGFTPNPDVHFEYPPGSGNWYYLPQGQYPNWWKDIP